MSVHHYGVAHTSIEVSERSFAIELHNHVSGAVIKVVGPREGVFEDPDRVIQESDVQDLARSLVQLLRSETGEAMATGASEALTE